MNSVCKIFLRRHDEVGGVISLFTYVIMFVDVNIILFQSYICIIMKLFLLIVSHCICNCIIVYTLLYMQLYNIVSY